MKRYVTSVLIFCISFLGWDAKAQPAGTANLNAFVKKHNLSVLWRMDSLRVKDYFDEMGPSPHFKKSAGPLGFIGSDFQRFYIHYTSVVRDKKSPYIYMVAGKTRVKNNICSFRGTIRVGGVAYAEEQNDKHYRQGAIYCICTFYEDSTQPSAGVITGEMKTKFCVNYRNEIFYNDLEFGVDGFCNNQFSGTWTSYKHKVTKKCNWGDGRIPDCGDLDSGGDKFRVYEKYYKNGWQNYADAYSDGKDAVKAKKAVAKEKEEWWK